MPTGVEGVRLLKLVVGWRSCCLALTEGRQHGSPFCATYPRPRGVSPRVVTLVQKFNGLELRERGFA